MFDKMLLSVQHLGWDCPRTTSFQPLAVMTKAGLRREDRVIILRTSHQRSTTLTPPSVSSEHNFTVGAPGKGIFSLRSAMLDRPENQVLSRAGLGAKLLMPPIFRFPNFVVAILLSGNTLAEQNVGMFAIFFEIG
jgi:hypothetical protein